jgi:hypothetical protein
VSVLWPEEVHEQYPSVALGDVYAVLTYCVRHRAWVRTYLAERERAGEEVNLQVCDRGIRFSGALGEGPGRAVPGEP